MFEPSGATPLNFYKQFASEYVQAVKEGRSLTNIGKNAVTDINGHKSPQDLIAS
jgi:hypothetical protein